MGSSMCGSLLAGGHYYGEFRRLSVILFLGFFFFVLFSLGLSASSVLSSLTWRVYILMPIFYELSG